MGQAEDEIRDNFPAPTWTSQAYANTFAVQKGRLYDKHCDVQHDLTSTLA